MFVIGERINPTGKPHLANALLAEKKVLIQEEALRQEERVADALDVNDSSCGIDRAKAISFAVEADREV
ncbi:MAG: hypothetical protein HY584_03355, partial [Candidatus Omnitrophica bacterium]|nr:hypothetical protein [Candidatus Omnitrophota bacterium]